MIKVGRVSVINYKKGVVRVEYPDNKTQSPELIVLQGRVNGRYSYSMPEIGEIGLCITLDNSFEGYYLGGGYTDKYVIPEGAKKGATVQKFKDGGSIIYDEKTSTLTLTSMKEIKIISKEKIVLNAPIIESEGDWNIKGSLLVSKLIKSTVDVVAKAISLLQHKHGGIQGGNSDTGGPK